MNYRHAFHAGNFADVVKHIVLTLIIGHLKQKDSPFRVIDTHAGIGLYDLTADEASRTGEWYDGIGRLIGPHAEPLPADIAEVLAPYLDIVTALNPPRAGGGAAIKRYPGSPWIASKLLRPQDQLVANELHPEDAAALRRVFLREPRAKMMELDGWTALKALLPPKERRGVILIDPPFEKPGELLRMAGALDEAVKRFATGIFAMWYPIKDPKPIADFHRRLISSGHGRLLAIELLLRAPDDIERLNGCGIVVLNAPYQLDTTLAPVLAFLGRSLAQADGARGDVRWLTA